MLKTGKRVRKLRKFSEEFKRKVVSDYESGQYGIVELERMYDVSNALIYRWIYTFSNYNKKGVRVVELADSQMSKIKELQDRIKELERAVGQKQLNIDYLNKMIDLASEDLNYDIKKNSNTLQSGGSKTIKKA